MMRTVRIIVDLHALTAIAARLGDRRIISPAACCVARWVPGTCSLIRWEGRGSALPPALTLRVAADGATSLLNLCGSWGGASRCLESAADADVADAFCPPASNSWLRLCRSVASPRPYRALQRR